MIPQPNQYIKILFKNGMVEEGVVVSWGPEDSVIKNNDNYLIIHNIRENIIAVKVRVADKMQQNKKISSAEPKLARDPHLRFKQLAELRKMQKKEEQAAIRTKLTTFESSGSTQAVDYGYPRILQPPVLATSPRKKAYKRIK